MKVTDRDKAIDKKKRAAAYYQANKEKVNARSKAYYQANKEKVDAWQRAYYQANKEKLSEQGKVYREANKEKKAAQDKAWREANRDKCLATKKAYRKARQKEIAAKQRAYYRANKDACNATSKACREANIERYRAKNKAHREANKANRYADVNKRKAIKKKAILTSTDLKAIVEIYKQRIIMAEKHGEEYHVDHIIPLSLGGAHHQDNLRIITAKENYKKRNRYDPELGGVWADNKLAKRNRRKYCK